MTVRRTRRADDDLIEIFGNGGREFGAAQAEQYHRDLAADAPTSRIPLGLRMR